MQYCTDSRYDGGVWARINVYRISNRKAIAYANRPTIDVIMLNLEPNDNRAWRRYRLIEWLIDISPEQFDESKHLPKLIDVIRVSGYKHESWVLSLFIKLYELKLINLSPYLGIHECIDNIVQHRRRLLNTKRTRVNDVIN